MLPSRWERTTEGPAKLTKINKNKNLCPGWEAFTHSTFPLICQPLQSMLPLPSLQARLQKKRHQAARFERNAAFLSAEDAFFPAFHPSQSPRHAASVPLCLSIFFLLVASHVSLIVRGIKCIYSWFLKKGKKKTNPTSATSNRYFLQGRQKTRFPQEPPFGLLFAVGKAGRLSL